MTRRNTLGKNQVSIRVLFSETDYTVLQNLAQEERTDIGSLVRRAVVHYFLIPTNSNSVNQQQREIDAEKLTQNPPI
jgi:hypothetical protein